MRGLRVLVVEDEAPVALLVESAVEHSGHSIAAIATNIKDALSIAARGDFDVALLDMNLNGQKAHALPVTLSGLKKPFAFLTGYGQGGVLERFADAPIVTKPFRFEEVAAVLALLAGRLQPRDATSAGR